MILLCRGKVPGIAGSGKNKSKQSRYDDTNVDDKSIDDRRALACCKAKH